MNIYLCYIIVFSYFSNDPYFCFCYRYSKRIRTYSDRNTFNSPSDPLSLQEKCFEYIQEQALDLNPPPESPKSSQIDGVKMCPLKHEFRYHGQMTDGHANDASGACAVDTDGYLVPERIQESTSKKKTSTTGQK